MNLMQKISFNKDCGEEFSNLCKCLGDKNCTHLQDCMVKAIK